MMMMMMCDSGGLAPGGGHGDYRVCRHIHEKELQEWHQEFADIGNQLQGRMHDNVIEGMPTLVKLFAGCSAGASCCN